MGFLQVFPLGDHVHILDPSASAPKRNEMVIEGRGRVSSSRRKETQEAVKRRYILITDRIGSHDKVGRRDSVILASTLLPLDAQTSMNLRVQSVHACTLQGIGGKVKQPLAATPASFGGIARQWVHFPRPEQYPGEDRKMLTR